MPIIPIMNYRNYITVEPNKRGGKPCGRGLRITVYVGMKATIDQIVQNYEKDNNLMIVSKDADMHDLSLVFGNPPKVIWLRLGNCSTLQVENLLRRNFNAIKLFYKDENLSLLALS